MNKGLRNLYNWGNFWSITIVYACYFTILIITFLANTGGNRVMVLNNEFGEAWFETVVLFGTLPLSVVSYFYFLKNIRRDIYGTDDTK